MLFGASIVAGSESGTIRRHLVLLKVILCRSNERLIVTVSDLAILRYRMHHRVLKGTDRGASERRSLLAATHIGEPGLHGL